MLPADTPPFSPRCGSSEGDCASSGSGLVLSQTSDTRPTTDLLTPDFSVSRADAALRRFRRKARNVLTAARLIQSHLQRAGVRYRAAFVTLTYRPSSTPTPYDITHFLKATREWLRRRGYPFRYVWVAELGGRGRFHYHVVIWLPRGLTLPMPDKSGSWPHGMSKIEWARRPVAYLAAYESKIPKDGPRALAYSEALPHGLRLSGFGGLPPAARLIRGWWMLPAYIREVFGAHYRLVRAVGGGWLSRLTGQWWPSPYAVSITGGGAVFVSQIGPFPAP
jgi:hypothetical protein